MTKRKPKRDPYKGILTRVSYMDVLSSITKPKKRKKRNRHGFGK